MTGTALPEDPAENELEIEFEINFPEGDEGRDQDEEWCEVRIGGQRRRIRFHDYDEIFAEPGLYEQLFYKELRCQSPRVVREMLEQTLPDSEHSAGDLRVLDIGAGNGIVGEELDVLGADSLTAVDIIEEAAAAADRDRPGLYDDYLVIDLTSIPPAAEATLAEGEFNCLTCVAALGFDDIPPEAFAGGYRFLEERGLIAISLKADFVSSDDPSGFAQMISTAIDDGTIEVLGTRRYQHRLSAAGEPIDYVVIIGEKRGELPVAVG